MIEPLFDLGADGKTLVPVLATGWTPSADGRTHSFTLRGGVKWHDGRDFTSADVAFSALELWRKLQNFGRDVFRNLEAVDTPDAGTAVFRFTQPIPAQLLAAALAPLANVVPRHLYEGTDLQNNPANINLVGTGPFRFGEYRRGEFFRLARNPAYWAAEQPLLDGIVYRVMPDKGAVAAALETGELELACFGGVSIEDMAAARQAAGARSGGARLRGAALCQHSRVQLRAARAAESESAAGDRACAQSGRGGRNHLPGLRQARGRPDPDHRSGVPHRRAAALSVRSQARRGAARRGRLSQGRRRHALRAEDRAGAVLRADPPHRRHDAPVAAPDRHRRLDREYRSRRLFRRGLSRAQFRHDLRRLRLSAGSGDLDHGALCERDAGRRSVQQPARLCEPGDGRSVARGRRGARFRPNGSRSIVASRNSR